MDAPIDWLLEGPAWVRYRTRLDLLGKLEDDPCVIEDRKEMLADPQIKGLIEELKDWPGPVCSRHNDAKLHNHKIAFLADVGIKFEDPGMSEVISKVMDLRDEDGQFEMMAKLYKRFGGMDGIHRRWFLCDAPNTIYALGRMGLAEDERVVDALEQLVEIETEVGFPCKGDKRFGPNFHGPGPATDPCPYANVLMLKAMKESKKYRDSKETRLATEMLLKFWEERKDHKYYLFGMGTKFKKLKVPFIYYDIMAVLDALSRYEWAVKDPRFQDMLGVVLEKGDEEGRFTPESVWMAWKGWEFNNKKEPSRWITLLVHKWARGQ